MWYTQRVILKLPNMLLCFSTDSDPDAPAAGPVTANASYELTPEFLLTEIKTKDYSKDPETPIVLDYFSVEKETPIVGNVRQMKFGVLTPDDDGTLARLRSAIDQCIRAGM